VLVRSLVGIMQPKSATSSTGGGHTAERAELADITFTKHADLSSPMPIIRWEPIV